MPIIPSTAPGDDAATATSRAPIFCKIKLWCAISGMGRSSTYEAIASGFLRAVKLNNTTLVDVEFGLTQLAKLPSARSTIGLRRRAESDKAARSPPPRQPVPPG